MNTLSTLWLLASEGPNGKFIPADPKEFWFGGAAFLIVLGLLVWKVFPLIDRALTARGERIQSELAAAEAAQAAADAEVAALRARLGDAAADARRLVDDARTQAVRLKADAAAKAEADAAALRAKAQSDANGMRAQAGADLQAEVTAKALAVAEEVAMANLDDATQAQLIEQYIQQVGASS